MREHDSSHFGNKSFVWLSHSILVMNTKSIELRLLVYIPYIFNEMCGFEYSSIKYDSIIIPLSRASFSNFCVTQVVSKPENQSYFSL